MAGDNIVIKIGGKKPIEPGIEKILKNEVDDILSEIKKSGYDVLPAGVGVGEACSSDRLEEMISDLRELDTIIKIVKKSAKKVGVEGTVMGNTEESKNIKSKDIIAGGKKMPFRTSRIIQAKDYFFLPNDENEIHEQTDSMLLHAQYKKVVSFFTVYLKQRYPELAKKLEPEEQQEK